MSQVLLATDILVIGSDADFNKRTAVDRGRCATLLPSENTMCVVRFRRSLVFLASHRDWHVRFSSLEWLIISYWYVETRLFR